MVEEVEGREANLNGLILLDMEIFEDRSIGIEKRRRPRHVRRFYWTVLSHTRDGEAGTVCVLVGSEVRIGIAIYERLQTNIRSTQIVAAAHRTGVRAILAAQPEIRAGKSIGLQRNSALPCRYPGKRPAVDHSVE